jgi:hypothetical protein
MAGQLTIDTLKASSGVLATQNGMSGIAKAWVNFDGTGTPAIRGSFNVSSITDNGTGNYTVNFTTAMPDVNYSIAGSVGGSTAGDSGVFGLSGSPSISTSSCKVICIQPGVNNYDATYMMVSVFR